MERNDFEHHALKAVWVHHGCSHPVQFSAIEEHVAEHVASIGFQITPEKLRTETKAAVVRLHKFGSLSKNKNGFMIMRTLERDIPF